MRAILDVRQVFLVGLGVFFLAWGAGCKKNASGPDQGQQNQQGNTVQLDGWSVVGLDVRDDTVWAVLGKQGGAMLIRWFSGQILDTLSLPAGDYIIDPELGGYATPVSVRYGGTWLHAREGLWRLDQGNWVSVFSGYPSYCMIRDPSRWGCVEMVALTGNPFYARVRLYLTQNGGGSFRVVNMTDSIPISDMFVFTYPLEPHRAIAGFSYPLGGVQTWIGWVDTTGMAGTLWVAPDSAAIWGGPVWIGGKGVMVVGPDANGIWNHPYHYILMTSDTFRTVDTLLRVSLDTLNVVVDVEVDGGKAYVFGTSGDGATLHAWEVDGSSGQAVKIASWNLADYAVPEGGDVADVAPMGGGKWVVGWSDVKNVGGAFHFQGGFFMVEPGG